MSDFIEQEVSSTSLPKSSLNMPTESDNRLVTSEWINTIDPDRRNIEEETDLQLLTDVEAAQKTLNALAPYTKDGVLYVQADDEETEIIH